jgi:hypothetical protein
VAAAVPRSAAVELWCLQPRAVLREGLYRVEVQEEYLLPFPCSQLAAKDAAREHMC